MSVRPPAVAGTFYPLDLGALTAAVHAHLRAAEPVELAFQLRILIVPHAGYVYSGPTAGRGYRLVAQSNFRRVVMLGPAHYVPFAGLALPGAEALDTPLGTVTVDPGGVAALLADSLVEESAAAHGREHSLEVQLPFLQVVAPGTPVVPLLTGAIAPWQGADVISPLLDEESLLLVSSDLSHFYDAATARRLDAVTAAAIERLDGAALDRESACGRTAIQIALEVARRNGFRAKTLDLRNSADTAGSPERVVGYGAFALGG